MGKFAAYWQPQLKPMNATLHALMDFLQRKNLHYTTSEEDGVVAIRCNGNSLFWTSVATTDESGTILSMLTLLQVKVPPAQRVACAKLLARLNYGRRLGSFHLDLEHGEVNYCISNFVGEGAGGDEVYETLLGLTAHAMDSLAPEVFKLVYGTSPGDTLGGRSVGRFARRELN